MTEPLRHPHRERFDHDMEKIRQHVRSMGELVDRGISRVIGGLVDRDIGLCDQVIADDVHINELQQKVRKRCFTVILTQTPVAHDLHEVIGLQYMAGELERMGDHCVSIARICKRLAKLPALATVADIPVLANYCAEQVRDMLSAVVDRDLQRAREVAAHDDRVDATYHRVFGDLVDMMVHDNSTVVRATNLIIIAHHLERIADRVTNLAEDLVFLATGTIEDLG